MARELEILGRLLAEPARPFVVVLGGVKVSDKIGVIESMLAKADSVLIGGAMCFTFFTEQGLDVGASLVEADKLDVARQALDAAASSACEFLLPVDVVVAPEPAAGAPRETVAADAMPGDHGVSTSAADDVAYPERITAAGTVFWNGPMGLFEIADFADGTRAVAEAVGAPRRHRDRRRRHGECPARLRPRREDHARLDGRRRLDGVPRGTAAGGRRGAAGRGGVDPCP